MEKPEPHHPYMRSELERENAPPIVNRRFGRVALVAEELNPMVLLEKTDERAHEVLERLRSRDRPIHYSAYLSVMARLGFRTDEADIAFEQSGCTLSTNLVIDFTNLHD